MDRDDDLAQLLWTAPKLWHAATLQRFLKRRCRPPLNDPQCLAITFYRRSGKRANYEFFCLLASAQHQGQPHGFWLSYLDCLAFPAAASKLDKWRMAEFLDLYSDGEEVWDSGDSQDEALKERKLRRGKAHEMPRGRKRSCAALSAP
jgi:hypothetical protein